MTMVCVVDLPSEVMEIMTTGSFVDVDVGCVIGVVKFGNIVDDIVKLTCGKNVGFEVGTMVVESDGELVRGNMVG